MIQSPPFIKCDPIKILRKNKNKNKNKNRNGKERKARQIYYDFNFNIAFLRICIFFLLGKKERFIIEWATTKNIKRKKKKEEITEKLRQVSCSETIMLSK